MRDGSRFHLTSKQLIFIIFGSTVATGILSLPRSITAVAGYDAWISIILGVCVPLTSLFLIERLGRKFPDLTMVEITQLLFGKTIGFLLVLGFISYTVFFESVVLRIATEVTSTFALRRTPIPVIALLISIAVIYIATKGAKTVGRLNELLFYVLLLDFVLVLLALNTGIDFTNIMPIGGRGFLAIAQGLVPTSYAYAGVEILFLIYFMVDRKSEVLKAGAIAVVLSMIFYLFVTLVCLLVFGADIMKIFLWPTLILIKTIEMPVIERLDFFFLAIWAGLAFRPVTNMCFAASCSLTQVLGLNEEKYYPFTVIILTVLIYILALIPGDIVQVFKFSTYAGYTFLVIAIGYPILFHFVAFLRKEKVKQYG